MWDDGPVGGGFSLLSALSINHNTVEVIVSPGRTAGVPARIHLQPPTNYMQVINRAVTVASSASRGLEIERQIQPFEADILRIKGGIHIHEGEVVHRVDVVEPAKYCGTMFREVLARSGFVVTGCVRSGRVPGNAVEIASHISAPLSWIIRKMNKSSDNFFAEMLLKALGAELVSPPGSGEKGLGVVRQFLAEIGIEPSQGVLADGSGVSRYNLLSASMLTRLLYAMYRRSDVIAEYIASLPQGGVDGTLEERFVSSRAQGVLRAKTGTMTGVSALAGYVPASDGRILVFAILINNFNADHEVIQGLQDRICEILTEFGRELP
jgi:D-alanyl-D-alanine carboxypeptidase/D-alanyl-D-alanine-endopeptidase (penicillin-binding protein 4)